MVFYFDELSAFVMKVLKNVTNLIFIMCHGCRFVSNVFSEVPEKCD